MLQADRPFHFGLKWTTVALNLQKFQTGLPIPFQKRMQCLKKWKQIGYTALLSVSFTLTIFFDMQDTNVIALFWDITRNIPEERRSHQHRGGSLKSRIQMSLLSTLCVSQW